MTLNLRQFCLQLGRRWRRSLLTVSALILLTSALGKAVTYGIPGPTHAVMQQATRIPRSLVVAVVLTEVAVSILITQSRARWRVRCGLLFTLCCGFLGHRILQWGHGPCGCYVNPAILSSAWAKALEGIAWASLLYMLLGSAIAVLGPDPAARPSTTAS
jgi:hypothetical protein